MKAIKILLLGLFLGMSLVTSAQDYDSFFRGQVAPGYKFAFNGNPFWNDQQYKDGSTVFYDGKEYNSLSLNVDAYQQILLLRRAGDAVPMIVDNDKTLWFKMSDSLFVNLNKAGVKDAPAGYFKVIYDKGAILFERIVKVKQTSTLDVNGHRIGYVDNYYNPSLTTFFEKRVSYWYYKDGKLSEIKSKKDLNNLYPDKKRDISRAGKSLPFSFSKSRARYLVGVIASIEGGQTLLPYKVDPFHVIRSIQDNADFVESTSQTVVSSVPITSLPSGWFQIETEDDEDGVVSYVSGSITKAIHGNKTYELGDKTSHKSGTAKISGHVYSLSSGEPVIEATIFDDLTGNYIRTDANGYYTITLPVGENVINFTEYSMEDFHAKVIIYDNAQMDVEMKERSELLESAMISANSRASHKTARMGVERISASNVKKFPTAFGEGDVLKAVQTMPGVKSVGEASGGINVRGGSTDQNLILFNGSTIYNPNHMFGLFSAFDSDIVDEMELYKSSIPAEYGGRISSVLDVRTKEGDSQKFTGAAGIGLLTSHAYIEGPLKKGKTSFVLGGRTTYSNWILDRLPESSGYSGGRANFSDATLGLTHKFTKDNVVQLNAYWSTDKFAFSGDTTFRYSNLNVALKWAKKFTPKSSFEISGGYDWYTAAVDNQFNEWDAFSLESIIRQGFLKGLIKTVAGNHTISYGAQVVPYALDRGNLLPFEGSAVVETKLGTEVAFEPSLWLADSWQLNDKIMFDYGTRLSSFYSVDAKKFYAKPEIRLSGKYSITNDFSLKVGFNTMNQYLHMVSNTTTISPMNTWKLADDKLKPQSGWQASAGAYLSVAKSLVDLSVEGYYKEVDNYLDYKSGATLVMNPNIADALAPTRGRAYGLELMLKKPLGKLNGWISYTYSRTLLQEMEDRGVETINAGAWYPAAHDKPHDFKFVGNYKFTHRYSLSFNVDYSTGRPVTIPVGWYIYDGGIKLAYSDRNCYRIPDYFRMDAAINIEPGHYLKKLTHFSVTLGVYNITGRRNAYSVYYTTSGGYNVRGHMISVFATQIPYININMRF